MITPDWTPAAAGTSPRRLYVYNGGFLTQSRIRRILTLCGYDISLGKPSEGDLIGVWGQSPTSNRGEAVSDRTNAPILRVEDAFLRSVRTGRDGDEPIGLLIDDFGVHFDPERPSRLEHIIQDNPLDDTALLNRARDGIERMRQVQLSKYNTHDPELPAPDPGYVLVIDQTHDDAAVKVSRANRNTFLEMLFCAREDHPAAKIIIKSHPETTAGHRPGYFREGDGDENTEFLDAPVSPHLLFEGAVAVYTVSSQLGFEAILAGHRPKVFGQPFYAGWSLTDDQVPLARRQKRLTRAQLFAAAMILYPVWYDPYRDRLCSFEEAVDALEAQTRAWRDDHRGWHGRGMRLWKRGALQRAFGRYRSMSFGDLRAKGDRRTMAWGSDETADARIEDGFIRSRGLGAELTPPLSLALDDLGIYYDPNKPSRLEALVEGSIDLPDYSRRRAERLVQQIIEAGVSKYNVGDSAAPDLPSGRRILVPGQVEDDASILLGSPEINTNAALLQATRTANSDAVILYKPHPDVEVGLRTGRVESPLDWADVVLDNHGAIAAIELADEVWTMTSTLGFEALLRGKRVTCLGQPFYAGWGLTDDRSMPLVNRVARPDLTAFAHACLIDYPRYFDPETGLPCPPEVAVERLASGADYKGTRALRLLAKAQGLFASYAHLWR